MKKRVIILVLLLFLRLGLNWIASGQYRADRAVTITGKVDRTDQSQTDCQISLGIFYSQLPGKCPVIVGDEAKLSGTLTVGLIDRVLGRVWVTSPKIEEVRPLKGARGRTSLDLLRERLVKVGQRLLPEPEAGLVLGVVLGYKDRIAPDFYNQLVNSGTIHIIVASGYNVMVVGNFLLLILLLLLKRPLATALAVVGMVFYASLAGGEPPVVRAVIMGVTGLSGLALGRLVSAVWSLFLAMVLMLVINPLLIVSISFQLSVAAAIGIFWLKPRLQRVVGGTLMQTELAATVAAMMLTAPIILYHFQRLSLIGILSNILILPLVPLLMLWGGVMLITGLVFSTATVMAYPVYGLAHLTVVLIGLFGG